MKKKRRNRVLAGLFLLSFLIILTSGCDKYARHKALTFFFTGVPPIEGEKNAEETQAAEKKKGNKFTQKTAYFVHGPKAAGECHQCHETSGSFSFRTRSKKEAGVIPRLRGGLSGRLVVPIKDLCAECHTSKSVQSAYNKALWIHGPVSDGLCTACHNPHQSPFQYMLIKEKSIDLCIQCHYKGYMRETEEHKKGGECISCHNPHIGKNRFLLKKDFNEVF